MPTVAVGCVSRGPQVVGAGWCAVGFSFSPSGTSARALGIPWPERRFPSCSMMRTDFVWHALPMPSWLSIRSFNPSFLGFPSLDNIRVVVVPHDGHPSDIDCLSAPLSDKGQALVHEPGPWDFGKDGKDGEAGFILSFSLICTYKS